MRYKTANKKTSKKFVITTTEIFSGQQLKERTLELRQSHKLKQLAKG